MVKKRLKPILPSLRERKRYLAFEIISKTRIEDFDAVSSSIWDSSIDLLGELGVAQAGIMVLKDKYDNNKGLVKVNNKYVNHLKSALMFIDDIDHEEVIVKSLGVSGILKKADKRYLIAK